MASLFIKELMLRGDLQRCLIVVPGNLAAELHEVVSRRQVFNVPEPKLEVTEHR